MLKAVNIYFGGGSGGVVMSELDSVPPVDAQNAQGKLFRLWQTMANLLMYLSYGTAAEHN